MAEELNGAEFWLPPEFLTDDFFAEKCGEGDSTDDGGGGCDPCFPNEFPYQWGYGSDLSSPVDSMTGTESSDEEDYMAGLARQMSQHSLQGDEKGPPFGLGADNPKVRFLTSRPPPFVSNCCCHGFPLLGISELCSVGLPRIWIFVSGAGVQFLSPLN